MQESSAVAVCTRWLPQVAWELWTTSNDQCGILCEDQKVFLNKMKPVARALEQQVGEAICSYKLVVTHHAPHTP